MKEIILKPRSGMTMLILAILMTVGSIWGFIVGINNTVDTQEMEMLNAAGIIVESTSNTIPTILIVVSIITFIVSIFVYGGLKIINPQEALVLTLFGKYIGTIKEDGFFFVNPFTTPINPASGTKLQQSGEKTESISKEILLELQSKKISLKAMTLSNPKQKINDSMGNPIEISIAVVWKISDTAMAVFNVDNYKEYLSLHCDSALRNIVKEYAYDIAGDEKSETLRNSGDIISNKIKNAIQAKVKVAGLEIVEARITDLAYAPEIAAVMLQRQQASAMLDARKILVEGAVDMVSSALLQISENENFEIDDERKAAMISNLLVVLCGNKDVQPVVNSGSLY